MISGLLGADHARCYRQSSRKSLTRDIKVGKVNIDEHPELAQKYGVMSIPTVLVIKDGEEVNKSVGAVPKKALLDLIG